MIEVERKIPLSESEWVGLEAKGKLLQEISFTDIYYDTNDYLLTGQNMWLRQREGNFELKRKVPQVFSQNDIYEEINEELMIKEALSLQKEGDLPSLLKKEQIFPFCHLKTLRKSYAFFPLHLDLDVVFEESFSYRIAEIELMVPSKEDLPDAEKQIDIWIASHHLQTKTKVRGKLIEYLFQKRPEHYQYLRQKGVLSC